MKTTGAVIVLLLAISPTLPAQSATDGPRAGAWGAETSFDADNPDIGAAVLRFRGDRSALLFGLSTSVLDGEFVIFGVGGQPVTLDRRTVTVDARLGYRRFLSPGSAVRPIVGGGILGSMAQTTRSPHQWSAGAYGELGLMRFFGPNFSVGATSDLHVRRSVVRADNQQDPTEIRVGFDAVRIAAMVVF